MIDQTKWTGQNCFFCEKGIYQGQEFGRRPCAGNTIYFHAECLPEPEPHPDLRDDAEARERALAKPSFVLEPWQKSDPRDRFRFTLGDYEEGGVGGWMGLTPAGVWLPIEAQQSRFLVFFGGEALPISKGARYVARFLIGGKYRVRVCADRTTGDIYVALPTEPEALQFIHWVRWQTWEEWVTASEAEGCEVRVVSKQDVEEGTWPLTANVALGWQVYYRPETGFYYCRRKRL